MHFKLKIGSKLIFLYIFSLAYCLGLNYLYKTNYKMVKIRSFSKHFLPVYIYWFSIIFVKFDFVVNNPKKYCFFQIVLFFNNFLFLIYSKLSYISVFYLRLLLLSLSFKSSEPIN